MNKLFITTAAISVAFATSATALAQNMKASLGHSTQVQVGKTSVAHGNAAAVDLKNGKVRAQGATATAIDLGKVKFNNQAQGGVQFPVEMLLKSAKGR